MQSRSSNMSTAEHTALCEFIEQNYTRLGMNDVAFAEAASVHMNRLVTAPQVYNRRRDIEARLRKSIKLEA